MTRDASINDQKQTAAGRCLLGDDQISFSIPENSYIRTEISNKPFAVIGQDRAMLAIDMALSIRSRGYNLFVSGPAGTGKRTAVSHVLSQIPPDGESLKDICLVFDFKDEECPKPLYIPAGKAQGLRGELRSFLMNLASTFTELTSQGQFRSMRDRMVLEAESEQQQLVLDFEDRLSAEGFRIVQVEDENEQKADILPLIDNEVSDFESLQELVAKGKMTESAYTSLRERQMQFIDEMKSLFNRLQKRRHEIQSSLESLRMEILHPHIKTGLRTIAENYPHAGVATFLHEVQSHLESPYSFIHALAAGESLPGGTSSQSSVSTYNQSAAASGVQTQAQNAALPAGSNQPGMPLSGISATGQSSTSLSLAIAPGVSPAGQSGQTISQQTIVTTGQSLPSLAEATESVGRGRGKSDLPEYLRIYDINILVDHSESKKNPVLIEQYPDYAKLFGIIENPPESAPDSIPPHLLVRAGSLLKASGGYLVLRAEDMLRDEDVYVGIKRALLEQAVEIRSPTAQSGSYNQAIKPKPIDIDLKVVVLGSDGLYEALFERDEEFQKLFKIPAEFDSTVDRTDAIFQAYADFFRMVCKEDSLMDVGDDGIAALLEYAVRVAEFKNKVSTRFSLLADILRESHYWADKRGSDCIRRVDVKHALRAREFLYNLPEEKIDEQILQGEILMHVHGSAVGRINGLAVMDRGFYAFGRPTVISAQAAPGSDGVVNVEREAGLSGEIHDKGTFIVESYIQATYARDFPLSINASICFEQSYSEVDGDSASSAEVYTLLSSISGIPLRQDIAVTGSVNQMGQIQPVGGVVEKIEGFYAVCRKVGITGTQGVIIPHQNIINLILNEELQEAVREGRFRIWAIHTIDEGMEILTGMIAGQRNAKGNYPADSINAIVERRLKEMVKANKDFGS